MQTITRERTRQFAKNSEIDCRGWLKFAIVEETYRYHRIRYTEFDVDAAARISLPATKSTDTPELY
jgi:hypothetical protein